MSHVNFLYVLYSNAGRAEQCNDSIVAKFDFCGWFCEKGCSESSMEMDVVHILVEFQPYPSHRAQTHIPS